MDPLDRYLYDVRQARAFGGVAETSYYPALRELLNSVGKTLSPPVHCILHPSNSGAGIPDGGLFTQDQARKNDLAHDNTFSILPARGVIEVKPPTDDLDDIAQTLQVRRYLERYGQVLVTNLRGFLLLGRDASEQPVTLERYLLSPNAAGFWNDVEFPGALLEQSERVSEYLKRVMMNPVALREPKDVAWFLASYARDARSRIERAELSALAALRAALEEALGLTFTDERGDHFFRSTLIQTLFYGVFSAWVLWHKQSRRTANEQFNWHEAEWSLHVPMISALYRQIASPSQLRPLGLVEVLDWTAAALNRIDTAVFFERFEEAHAVQYFYEPFLQAFDPQLRKQLGVWYTPPEIVSYMVERVDQVLRNELGLSDGLADESVYVLDPATGTGSYLVEVLKRIDRTLRERGADALSAQRVKQAATGRVFGFEILPAPFVVAHLQLGLYLQTLGAPLGAAERAGVYLTNALTGWTPNDAGEQAVLWPELRQERDLAERIKQQTRVLVVIGNPPYSGFAGIAVDEERELTEPYQHAQHTRQPQGQGLNDLYVRFFGMADQKIVEGNGRGVVCYISNYSWLEGLSFTAMRERYLGVFDRIWIDNLNGDKYKTGKVTPWGEPDPSIFSTEWSREGIQVGTAITLLTRTGPDAEPAPVRYREFWGRQKRAELLAALDDADEAGYQPLDPPGELGLPFMPLQSAADYLSWPLLPDLFPTSFPGVKTSRDELLVDIDREALVRRMELYFDPKVSNDQLRRLLPESMERTSSFDPEATRAKLVQRGFLRDNIVRYCYRPFDVRWLYWEPETKLLDRNRADYFPQVFPGNRFLYTTARTRRTTMEPTLPVTDLADINLMDGSASGFPMYIEAAGQRSLFDTESSTRQRNLSMKAEQYLRAISAIQEDLYLHGLNILNSARFRIENADAARYDWPRIPLPDSAERLQASAALGEKVARLLDIEQPVSGVTRGTARRELATIGLVTTVDGRQAEPADLALTVNWGYRGSGGAVMPGGGKAEPHAYTAEELNAIAQGGAALGLDRDQALALLGEHTYDIYLNQRVFWSNVPERVWEYTLGGYQVIKKWLSYREADILGRPLSLDEVQEVTHIARRIAAILLLEPDLDANYAAVKAATYAWPST